METKAVKPFCPLRRARCSNDCSMWFDVERVKSGAVKTKERLTGCAILRALLRFGGIL